MTESLDDAPNNKESDGPRENYQLASVMLDLARQQTERGAELEDHKWRINFSLWAFLGGIAYVYVNGRIPAPSHWFVYLALMFAPLMHGIATYRLTRQQENRTQAKDYWRGKAESSLSLKAPTMVDRPLSRHCGLTWFDWRWLAWEVTVTIALAIAVALLISQGPQQQTGPRPGDAPAPAGGPNAPGGSGGPGGDAGLGRSDGENPTPPSGTPTAPPPTHGQPSVPPGPAVTLPPDTAKLLASLWDDTKRGNQSGNSSALIDAAARLLAPALEQAGATATTARELAKTLGEHFASSVVDETGKRAVDAVFDYFKSLGSGGDRKDAVSRALVLQRGAVRFELNGAEPPPSGQATLQGLLAAAQGQRAFWILVGSADRSGLPNRNAKLAIERVDSVKAYLMGRGVDGHLIAAQTLQDFTPPMPTELGAKDPENRRTEVILLRSNDK